LSKDNNLSTNLPVTVANVIASPKPGKIASANACEPASIRNSAASSAYFLAFSTIFFLAYYTNLS
jgi:hypothetical protein